MSAKTPFPNWANSKNITKDFGISRRILDAAAGSGFIRSCKMGNTPSSQRLFCAEDVDTHLKRLAANLPPQIMSGKC